MSKKDSFSQATKIIGDNYETIRDVQDALRRHCVEAVNLIVGIDYTGSNTMHQSFGGKSLHWIDPSFTELPPPYEGYDSIYDSKFSLMNPYQQVLFTMGKTLEAFDEDNLIPVYGFGDRITKGNSIFNIKDRLSGASTISNDSQCVKFWDVLYTYNQVTPSIDLSGPTSFAPLINHVVDKLKKSKQFHILLIIADGQVNDNGATVKAIQRASKKAPLSIVTFGVGDGPWDTMENYDDDIKNRKFDNFQFVNCNGIINKYWNSQQRLCASFATNALQEIPIQYEYLKRKKRIR